MGEALPFVVRPLNSQEAAVKAAPTRNLRGVPQAVLSTCSKLWAKTYLFSHRVGAREHNHRGS